MISIVIPAYNEADAIAGTIGQINNVMGLINETPYEIIVVNDCSTDETGDRAKAAGAKVITKLQNLGYGHSLKLGILSAQYDLILITDADGTYPIEYMPVLIKHFHVGYDMVVGARTGENYRENKIKHPMRLLLKFLVEFACGRSIPDPNSGLRIFSKKDILPMLPTLCDRFSFTTSMTLAYMMLQKYVLYIDIPYEARIGKSKVKLFKDSLLTLQYIVQAVNFYNPIKIYLVISGFLFLSGCLSIVVGLLLRITTSIQLGVGLFIASTIVFALGLVADLLKQLSLKK